MPYSPAPAFVSVTPADPGAVTNVAYKMAGLGVAGANAWVLTPQVTGRILLIASGVVTGGGAGTATLQLAFGTGAAPANAASATGTQQGGQPAIILDAAGLQGAFSLTTVVTGQAVPSVNSVGATQAGTALWFDIAQKMSANSLQLQFLSLVAIEF